MKKIYSYLSLILAILMLTSAFASCTGGGGENESSEIESESVSEESEEGEDTSDEGGINDAPKLEGDDAKATADDVSYHIKNFFSPSIIGQDAIAKFGTSHRDSFRHRVLC